ncbi:Alpha (1,3) fucosyltransferase C [Trichuris trichiura]|uniref:Fucosyltransferase n=1 Tax=Trichuris trichiura TaxID=36087 RepID=A0A077Z077_TRITR|nr:Alpha (1,3) fucosyltransferase C [Trichuris trichiura]
MVSIATFTLHTGDTKFNWTGHTKPVKAVHVTKINRNITILMWVSFFGTKFDQKVLSICPDLNCRITNNRSELNSSSAVVFHDRNVYTSDLPEQRLPEQHFVFFLLESPYHTSTKAFQQLSTGFYTLTMNYRRDADVHFPFGFFKPKTKSLSPTFWKNLRKEVASKKKLIAWFVSNCQSPSAREFYVKQLQKHVPVDVYGQCGPFKCPRNNSYCFESVVRQNYKFYIAFENSVCVDYVTEKYFDRLNDLVVPIVFGRKIYEAIGPNNSFIAADDFKSPKELADYLKRLDKDVDQYLKYFEWMNHAESVGYKLRYETGFCKLCSKLQEQQKDWIATPSKTAKNLTAWYKKPGTCHPQYGKNVHKL